MKMECILLIDCRPVKMHNKVLLGTKLRDASFRLIRTGTDLAPT